jgi:hypothetical protein
VVYLLVFIQLQNVTYGGVTCPDQVKVLTSLELLESTEFHRVDDSVINVRAVRIQERHEKVLDLAATLIRLDGIQVLLRMYLLNVLRIGEESSRRSTLECGFHEFHVIARRFENAVRQSALLSFEKRRTHRVLKDELLHLVIHVHIPLLLQLSFV